jgi:hypothetical protein
MISPMAAWCALDVHTFWPFTIHESPSRSARVATAARSEPAPGSLNSWQAITSPRCRPGRYAAATSGVAWAATVGATIPRPMVKIDWSGIS